MFQRAAAAPDEFLTAARPRASGGAAGPAARRPRGRGAPPPGQRERSAKIKLKIKKTDFEN